MPITLVIPKMDIGILLSFSPRQISIIASDHHILITRTLQPGIHTRNSTTNNINTNRTRTAAKEPRDNQRREVRRRRGRDQPDQEQNVCAKVAGHATSVLCQGHEEEREDGCANVPGGCGPVEPGEVVLTDAELAFHLHVTGAVGAGGETGEDGAGEVLVGWELKGGREGRT